MKVFYFYKTRVITVLLLIGLLLLTSLSYALTTEEKKQWQRDENVVWRVKTDEKLVALTFEDGPDEKFTPVILDLLKEHNAKATFFTVGVKAKEHPELIKRIKEEGHEIENHSMTHPNLLKLPAKSIESQVKTADITLKRITGQNPKYFRPPQGKINKGLVEMVKGRGQKIVLWSLTIADFPYSGILPKDTTLPDLIPSGSIITLKDDENYKSETFKALYFLLVALQNEKYKFVTVDELINTKDAKINEEPPKREKEQPNQQLPEQPQQPQQLTPEQPLQPPQQQPSQQQPPLQQPTNPGQPTPPLPKDQQLPSGQSTG